MREKSIFFGFNGLFRRAKKHHFACAAAVFKDDAQGRNIHSVKGEAYGLTGLLTGVLRKIGGERIIEDHLAADRAALSRVDQQHICADRRIKGKDGFAFFENIGGGRCALAGVAVRQQVIREGGKVIDKPEIGERTQLRGQRRAVDIGSAVGVEAGAVDTQYRLGMGSQQSAL